MRLFLKLLTENEHQPHFRGSRGNTLLIKYTASLWILEKEIGLDWAY